MLHFSFWQRSEWKHTAIIVMNYPRMMVLNCDSDLCWWPGWHYSHWRASKHVAPIRIRQTAISLASSQQEVTVQLPRATETKKMGSFTQRIKSASSRQVSFHKGQNHRSKLSSTRQSKENPKDTVRIQQASNTPVLWGALEAPGQPLSTAALVLVFSQ